MESKLTGVFPALTTPFDGERIAPERLVANVARYERCGIAGYLVLGSTGEAPLLEEDEKLSLLRAARAAIPQGKLLIAGIGLETTTSTIRLAERAARVGADLGLVLTPFYFRERMSHAALCRHYTAIADASPIPILLYSVPKFTGLALRTSLVERLAFHPNIVGIKDSAGDLASLLEMIARVPPEFDVLCGSVSIFVDALAGGARGGILAAANVFPEPLVAIAAAHRAGCDEQSRASGRRVLDACRGVVDTAGVAGIKAAMDLRGLHGGAPRPPLLPATGEERAKIRAAIEALVAEGALARFEI